MKENPIDSYVYIQAYEREGLDWNITDRLVSKNTDFKDFVNVISDFYRNGRNETLERMLG